MSHDEMADYFADRADLAKERRKDAALDEESALSIGGAPGSSSSAEIPVDEIERNRAAQRAHLGVAPSTFCKRCSHVDYAHSGHDYEDPCEVHDCDCQGFMPKKANRGERVDRDNTGEDRD